MTAPSDLHAQGRRRLLKALAAAGGAFAGATVLPSRWTKPVIDSVMIPLHAQGSPIVGFFSTTALDQAKSIFDFIVPPLHAAPIGSLIVGNASFVMSWNVGEDTYEYCASGIGDGGGFDIADNGTRNGNALSDVTFPGTGISVTNQTVSALGISFDAHYGSDSTNSIAPPGIGSCFLNTSTETRMSSPYRDERNG